MQPIAAYYMYVATAEAKNASSRRQYRSLPPKRSAATRFGSALATIFRPVRSAASAA